jgi:hypothetical protein
VALGLLVRVSLAVRVVIYKAFMPNLEAVAVQAESVLMAARQGLEMEELALLRQLRERLSREPVVVTTQLVVVAQQGHQVRQTREAERVRVIRLAVPGLLFSEFPSKHQFYFLPVSLHRLPPLVSTMSTQ